MKDSVIMVVDDEEVFLLRMKNHIMLLGYTVVTAVSGHDALAILEKQPVDLVITDFKMPDMNGLQLMLSARELYPLLPVIVLTARGSIENAVEAMRHGALDYLEKPFNPQSFDLVLQRALQFGRLSGENKLLRQHYSERFSFQSIVTQSPLMRQVLEMALRMTESPRTTICLTGESGTGKEVLSRAIHFGTGGLPGNFVALNCAAIPESLMESELFGHVRGAFTGADRDRDGKFNLAKGGTLLLDEIGDMSLALQAKLLRVLEERRYEKIGSNKPLPADFRVIVATHHNIAEQVRRGLFREDLFYRINVVPITIPPLRERKEDIPLLVQYYLQLFREHHGKEIPGISEKASKLLIGYDWPGNVRELRNLLEYATIMIRNELIRPEHLRIPTRQQSDFASQDSSMFDYHVKLPVVGISLDTILSDFTDKILELTLVRCHGNKTQAATLLKINRKKFYR